MRSINIAGENNSVREGGSAGNIGIKTFKCKDREANNSIYAVNAEQRIKQISSDGWKLFLLKEDQKQNFSLSTTSECQSCRAAIGTAVILDLLNLTQLMGLFYCCPVVQRELLWSFADLFKRKEYQVGSTSCNGLEGRHFRDIF